MALVRILLPWTLQNGHLASNGLYFTTADSPTTTNLEEMADAASTAYGASDFRAFVKNEILLRPPTAQVMGFASGKVVPLGEAVPGTSDVLAGQDTTTEAESLPPQVAEVVSLRTGVPGRANRGRIYLPPVGGEQLNASGLLGNDVVAAARDLVSDIYTAVDNAKPSALVVASASQAEAVPVITITADNKPGTQRRRRKA